MNDPKWYGIVRHVLTLLGGVLTAFGILEGDEAERGVGLVMGLIGGALAVWGFIASVRAREKQITNAQFSAMKKK